MRRKKAVLIVGGSGFLGSHLALKMRDSFKVFISHYKNYLPIPGVTSVQMDAAERDQIKRVVYTINPDTVIYTAGKEDVEWAEEFSRDAEKVHSVGPITVLTAAEILQPKFIFISNPYVFDGTKGNYVEKFTPLPHTQLGRSKLRSENFIRGKSLNYLIIRSSPLFGLGTGGNPSFLDHLRIKLSKKETIELPTSEIHSFAPVYAFADFMKRIVEGGPKNTILHYGGLTKMTYYDFGKAFAQNFGFDPNLIYPKRDPLVKDGSRSTTLDYSLNSSNTVKDLKVNPLLLEQGFDLFKKEIISRF